MSSSRGSNVVFVGNIPYELTEEQLIEVFKEVGPVVSFRLVFDKENGRPRGYGFCEYHDSETAASAVRNLNNVEVGGRQLRVDYADNDPATSSNSSSNSSRQNDRMNSERHQQQHQQHQQQQQQQQHHLHQLHQSQQQQQHQHQPQILPPNVNTSQTNLSQQSTLENISQTLKNSMNHIQLLEILSTMKLYIQTHADQARALLAQNPQLCYALFQIMLDQNIVDPNILRLMQQSSLQGQTQPQPTPVQNTTPLVTPNYGPQPISNTAPIPQQHQPNMFTSIPQQPMIQQPLQQPLNIQQPPIQQPPMQQPPSMQQSTPIQQPPPMQQPPIQQPLMQQAIGMPVINTGMVNPSQSIANLATGNINNMNDLQMQETQKSLLLQVLNLPQAQIDLLPPDQRNHLLALKQQLLLQARPT